MKRLFVFAVLLPFLPIFTMGETLTQKEGSADRWNGHIETVLVLDGVLADDELTKTMASSTVRLEGHQFDCTFSATCNADGTIDLTTSGCTPTAHTRILKWVIDICTS